MRVRLTGPGGYVYEDVVTVLAEADGGIYCIDPSVPRVLFVPNEDVCPQLFLTEEVRHIRTS